MSLFRICLFTPPLVFVNNPPYCLIPKFLSGEVIEAITPTKPVKKPAQCSAPSWEQKVYEVPTTISKDGRVYSNKWWVSAENKPGDSAVTDTSGNGTDWGKVWEDKGGC